MQTWAVKWLSKEAMNAMKGVKTVKEAMEKAKSSGVEDEIRRVYPLEGSRFDLSKNKKGFLQVGKVDEAEAKLMEEAKKYKSAEEFVKSKINFQHWWRVSVNEFWITKSMKIAREKFNKLQTERDNIINNSQYWKIDDKFKKRFDDIDKELEKLDYDKRWRNIKEKWFYFTNDKDYLKTFDRWAVTDAFVDLKNPYIVKKWEIDLIEEAGYNPKTIQRLEDQWYDGLIYNNGEQLLAFDKSSIKTRKQLMDIYNKIYNIK